MEQLFNRKEINEFLNTYRLKEYADADLIIKRIMQYTRKHKWEANIWRDEGFSIFVGSRNEHEIYVYTYTTDDLKMIVMLQPVIYGMLLSELQDDDNWNYEIYCERVGD